MSTATNERSSTPGEISADSRRGVREVLEVKVAVGGLSTRAVLRDFAQEVMDAQLAPVDPDEMAQLLALVRESTVA